MPSNYLKKWLWFCVLISGLALADEPPGDIAWKADYFAKQLAGEPPISKENLEKAIQRYVREKALPVWQLKRLAEVYRFMRAPRWDFPGLKDDEAWGAFNNATNEAFYKDPQRFPRLREGWEIVKKWTVLKADHRTPYVLWDMLLGPRDPRETTVEWVNNTAVETDFMAMVGELEKMDAYLRPNDGYTDHRFDPQFDKTVQREAEMKQMMTHYRPYYEEWRRVYEEYSPNFGIRPLMLPPREYFTPCSAHVAEAVQKGPDVPWGKHKEKFHAITEVCTPAVRDAEAHARRKAIQVYFDGQRLKFAQNAINNADSRVRANADYFQSLKESPLGDGSCIESELHGAICLEAIPAERKRILEVQRKTAQARTALEHEYLGKIEVTAQFRAALDEQIRVLNTVIAAFEEAYPSWVEIELPSEAPRVGLLDAVIPLLMVGLQAPDATLSTQVDVGFSVSYPVSDGVAQAMQQETELRRRYTKIRENFIQAFPKWQAEVQGRLAERTIAVRNEAAAKANQLSVDIPRPGQMEAALGFPKIPETYGSVLPRLDPKIIRRSKEVVILVLASGLSQAAPRGTDRAKLFGELAYLFSRIDDISGKVMRDLAPFTPAAPVVDLWQALTGLDITGAPISDADRIASIVGASGLGIALDDLADLIHKDGPAREIFDRLKKQALNP